MNSEIKKKIEDCCEFTSQKFEHCEYLESNHRRFLARSLRRAGFKFVYEEIPIVYIDGIDPVPFGHGFIDIAIVIPKRGAILLELKITQRDASRQLAKYLKHWKYSEVLCGFTINFFNNGVKLCMYDDEGDSELRS